MQQTLSGTLHDASPQARRPPVQLEDEETALVDDVVSAWLDDRVDVAVPIVDVTVSERLDVVVEADIPPMDDETVLSEEVAVAASEE